MITEKDEGKVSMLKFKITTTVLVIFAMLFLVACSGNGNTGNAGQESANPSAGPSGETPAKRGSITVSMYDRGNVPAEAGTAEKNTWTDWVVENGPADVKFITVPRWESTDKFN